ncbi:MAG: chromate transporter, chromate ion transporter family [Moraxellaceae bacterium]|jgi:chromate transporter|nr:chromate transporter, chromate ion transporter family [Moraxellaceae bacterium]
MDLSPPAPVSFREALKFWWKLGWISFGGPAGQIAIMHEELVTRRRWISEKRFLHALNYCMVLPGPEAQQLATYIGWLMHGTRGGIAAGALFVLPSLFILIALSWLYMAYGHLPVLTALLWGIKPAVVAIVLAAAWRIGKRALKNRWLWALAGLSFLAIAWLRLPFPAIVLGAAAIGLVGGHLRPDLFRGAGHAIGTAPHAPALIDDATPPPAHARPDRGALRRHLLAGLGLFAGGLALLWLLQGSSGLLTDIALFFSKAALLTFGGAYAVLPYVTQATVGYYGWLTIQQMMDGLALGETTPGPLIMIVAFVGFVAGWAQDPLWAVAGACVATFFTFLPSFVFILVGGPLVEATHDELRLVAPLTAITAAVVGVIVSLALFFGVHVVWPAGLGTGPADWPALALAAMALVALVRYEAGIMRLLAASAVAGLSWQWLPGVL